MAGLVSLSFFCFFLSFSSSSFSSSSYSSPFSCSAFYKYYKKCKDIIKLVSCSNYIDVKANLSNPFVLKENELNDIMIKADSCQQMNMKRIAINMNTTKETKQKMISIK